MSFGDHSEFFHAQLFDQPRHIEIRNFNQFEYESDFQVETEGWLWTFLNCPDQYDTVHKDAIVVAVDGACRDNGKTWAKSGYGIFVHRDNYWNRAEAIDDDQIHTSQRAELHAGVEALKIAKRIRKRNRRGPPVPKGPYRRLRRVVIKSDSVFLVKGMTEWIYKWQKNGFINSAGRPVSNKDLFMEIEQLIDDLNSMDVQVQFWHVRRELNQEADCLANAALTGTSTEEALEDYYFSD